MLRHTQNALSCPGSEVCRDKSQDASPAGVSHRVAVAFCADRYMEAPLHVAASSLLRHLHSDYTAHFYFLLAGFSPGQVQCLRRTLDSVGHAYTMTIVDEKEVRLPAELPLLHGSVATYYRLLLPELVDEDRLLYLDSDLEVDIDVSSLFEEDMGAKPVGFVVDGLVSLSLDNKFQRSIGRLPNGPAFNAGVTLFNLPQWHRQKCSLAVWEFASKHRTKLACYDETILNALFADSCYRLRREFNFGVTAGHRGEVPPSGILHFVGSPKPWDIAARYFFSPFADRWFNELKHTAVPFSRRVTWFNLKSWQRLPRILGGYKRAFKSLYGIQRQEN